jgi:hypothetical protein
MRRRSPIALAAALLIGCTTERAAAPAADSVGSGYSLHQAQQQNGAFARLRAPAAQPVPMAFGESEVRTATSPESRRMIIAIHSVVEVDSLEPAVAHVKELATRLGGYVGSSGIVTATTSCDRQPSK